MAPAIDDFELDFWARSCHVSVFCLCLDPVVESSGLRRSLTQQIDLEEKPADTVPFSHFRRNECRAGRRGLHRTLLFARGMVHKLWPFSPRLDLDDQRQPCSLTGPFPGADENGHSSRQPCLMLSSRAPWLLLRPRGLLVDRNGIMVRPPWADVAPHFSRGTVAVGEDALSLLTPLLPRLAGVCQHFGCASTDNLMLTCMEGERAHVIPVKALTWGHQQS